jgi:hypothetical protein
MALNPETFRRHIQGAARENETFRTAATRPREKRRFALNHTTATANLFVTVM